MNSNQTEEDEMAVGYHSIPSEEKLKDSSFVSLAVMLHGVPVGSPAYLVIDREIKKRHATDSMKIARKNIFIGSLIGGVFTILGVLLGCFLKN